MEGLGNYNTVSVLLLSQLWSRTEGAEPPASLQTLL